jgi:hypothetical protein
MIQHSSIPVNLSTLIEDSSHRVVTDAEKTDWNEAHSLEHSHSNKTNLDNINQNLGTTHSPTFNELTVTSENVDVIKFDTSTGNPTHTEGKLFYDPNKHALSYYNEESDVTVNIGQESLIRVRNETGSKILNGTVVYPTGVLNNEVLVGLANAHDKEKCTLIGVTTHDIPTGTAGYVTKFGEVADLNTAGFNIGEIVYLSDTTDGLITNTKPINGGSYIIPLGAIKRVGTTDGSIIVDINTTELSIDQSSSLGFSNYDTATVSVTDTSTGAVLLITPVNEEYDFYQYGVKYTKTTDTITLPDEEGMFVIYYNLGTLAYIKNPTTAEEDTLLRSNPVVTYIYWNADDKKSEYVAKEMHKIGMAAVTRTYLHFVLKCRWMSGLAPNTISADGGGNLDADAQFGMDAGGIVDEDLYHSTPTISSLTGLPIYYLSGTVSAPTLRGTTNAGFSVLTTGTGRLAYNTVSGSNFVLSEVPNGNYVCCHVIAVNENNINKRVVALVGQTMYTKVADARTGAFIEINNVSMVGIIPQEVKAIATFILETRDTYLNAVKARIRTISTGVYYVDWRQTQIAGSSGTPVSNAFNDALFQIYDNADPTKILQFQLGNVSSSSTLELSAPNASGTLIISEGVNGHQTIKGGLTSTGELYLYNNSVDNQGITITSTGNVGIGTNTTTSKLQVVGLPSYEDNDTAIADGLTVGAFYHTSTGIVKVVF